MTGLITIEKKASHHDDMLKFSKSPPYSSIKSSTLSQYCYSNNSG